MRLLGTAAAAVIAMLLLGASQARAAEPSLGPVSATDIQGTSALLVGTVDPEGLATTYYYEYATSPSFAGAARTATYPAGSASEARPARAAVSGLEPSTSYHFRLVASNASGTTTGTAATFATTKGFGFLPGEEGFAVHAAADGGAPATRAGQHPYQLDFKVGLNQGGPFESQPGATFPDGDIRDLSIEMPPGLLINPGVVDKCTAAQFNAPRQSPFEEPSQAGESCPDRSQVGTVEVRTSLGGGQARRFGLYNLRPAPGVAAQLGFAPFGVPVLLDGTLRRGEDGSYTLVLHAANMPQTLDLYGLGFSLWGIPWAASHDGERGNCLNEAEPAFPWCKASAGEVSVYPPEAYLTLPTACSGPLYFTATADSWQQPAQVSAQALNRTSGGAEADMSCKGLVFQPQPVGQLTDTKASSPSGYNFRLSEDLSPLSEPEQFAHPQVKTAVVHLPAGVSVNPSVGAGLGVCHRIGTRWRRRPATRETAAPTPPSWATSKWSARSSKGASRGPSTWPPPTTTPSAPWWRSTWWRGCPSGA